jgi:hypothetical protein
MTSSAWHVCQLSGTYIGEVQCNIVRDNANDIMPYLLTLANTNDPICVVLPKVAKSSAVI